MDGHRPVERDYCFDTNETCMSYKLRHGRRER